MDSLPTSAEARLAAAVARLDARINWERMKRTAATRFSLEPARDLAGRLGDPQRSMRAVHVAGSKGKGSTAAWIAAGLRAAGLSEALYTSPHVVHLRERLRIRGRDVDAEPFARALEAALDERDRAEKAGSAAAEATWFDLVTCAAFVAARDAGVRWMVAECGLGGRLDSTNVVDGEVCVITNIELEHQAVLGPTRAAIAGEKAGILKPGCTLVTGVPRDDEAGEAIERVAARLGVSTRRPLQGRWSHSTIAERNLALAGEALDVLGERGVRDRHGKELQRSWLDPDVLGRARLPGRLEWFERAEVAIALDGGHVPASVRDALRDLTAQRGGRRCSAVVLGMARDKDLPGILKAVSGLTDRVVCTSVGSELHFTPDEIAMEALKLGLVAETAATPSEALTRALTHAPRGGWVAATGSLYLVGSLRPALTTTSTGSAC